MTTYLDHNATTPVDPRVAQEVLRFMTEEFGNAGSRTHEFGVRAQKAVQKAREQIASVVDASREEVIFTSGATESNNIAILGLASYAAAQSRKHIVSTAIEHKAVLEPLEELSKRGFQITLVRPNPSGWVEPADLLDAVRPDTVLVSVMQANNETGVLQPIDLIAEELRKHDVYLHVDAAQGFGKDMVTLRNRRIDLISISGHKIFGPKGIGALVARNRGNKRPPLAPITFGGGQEGGLRPGTVPVPLAVGLGVAAELSQSEHQARRTACQNYRSRLVDALSSLEPKFNGDPSRTLPHVVNVSFPGIDSEALMVALKPIAAVSNGSACTSASYKPSHVLEAMGIPKDQIRGAIRISWSHDTKGLDPMALVEGIKMLG